MNVVVEMTLPPDMVYCEEEFTPNRPTSRQHQKTAKRPNDTLTINPQSLEFPRSTKNIPHSNETRSALKTTSLNKGQKVTATP